MSSPLNDSRTDHPIGPENRIESRDSKDNRDLRFENRDTKTEKKELHGEARRDPPSAKSEKDVRVEGRCRFCRKYRHKEILNMICVYFVWFNNQLESKSTITCCSFNN